MEPERPRSPRKDVERNRQLLLEAAERVFARDGLDATLDDVARDAGLGVATAYRHFANKQELAAALFDRAIGAVIQDAELALTVADPWEALHDYVFAVAERQARNRGLRQALVGFHPALFPQRLRALVTDQGQRLLDRARGAGAIRPDIEVTDFNVLFAALAVVFDIGTATDPDLWRRYLTLILDGMHASGDPLPGRALLVDELPVAIQAAKQPRGRAQPGAAAAADGRTTVREPAEDPDEQTKSVRRRAPRRGSAPARPGSSSPSTPG